MNEDTSSLSLLDSLDNGSGGGGDMWRGVGAGDIDTVTMVHSYHLPPDQELQPGDNTNLLLAQCDASLLQTDVSQPQIISFKKPIFCHHLSEMYHNRSMTDTHIITQGGQVLMCHSLVMGAASSMMKTAFVDASDKIVDSDHVILMPDFNTQEV